MHFPAIARILDLLEENAKIHPGQDLTTTFLMNPHHGQSSNVKFSLTSSQVILHAESDAFSTSYSAKEHVFLSQGYIV